MKTFPTTAILTLATGIAMHDWSEIEETLIPYYLGENQPVYPVDIPPSGMTNNSEDIDIDKILEWSDKLMSAAQASLGQNYEPLTDDDWQAYRDRMIAKIGPFLTI